MKHTSAAALAAAMLAGALAANAPAHAMTGGVAVTDPNAAPWMATLAPVGAASLLDSAGCGGALIAADRVLTAARCVDGADPSTLQVHLGANPLSVDPGEVRGVAAVAVMPGFHRLPSPVALDDADLDSVEYDLAVVELDRPVTDIRPIRPGWTSARPGERMAFYAHGLTGRASQGRGTHTTADVRDDILHRADLVVSPARDCGGSWTPADVNAESTVCAADPAGRTTGCWLDAGSPAVRTADGVSELVGVYSFGGETAGRDCAPPAPAVFADVPRFRNWVLGPLADRAPFPAGRPTVTRTGDTLHCAMPSWRSEPSSVHTAWVALVGEGDRTRELPIDGVDAPELRLADDLNLHGNRVACEVRARNSGGYVRVLSDGLGV